MGRKVIPRRFSHVLILYSRWTTLLYISKLFYGLDNLLDSRVRYYFILYSLVFIRWRDFEALRVNHSVYRTAREFGTAINSARRVYSRARIETFRLGGKEREREDEETGNGHRSPSVSEPEFTDTSRGVLIFISCPVSFLQPTPRRLVSPFARVLTRPKDDSARIIDSISSETYRRDISRGFGGTRSVRSSLAAY